MNIPFFRNESERYSLFLVCSENSGLSGRYHAGLWSGKRWSCCRLSTRSAEGCDTCSSWSATKSATNVTNPSSTTTSVSTTSTSVPGSTINNTISTTTVTSDHRAQLTNAEANNNPIIQTQARSTIGSYLPYIYYTLWPLSFTKPTGINWPTGESIRFSFRCQRESSAVIMSFNS